ncbi:cbb3-type cytochrome c oxidase subunit II [Paracoccus versutus]
MQDRPIHATMAAEERDAEAALQPGKLSMGLVAGIIVAASTGGIVEIAPLFTIQRTVEIPADLRPLTPLELGREIHMREGCHCLPQPDDPHPGR